MLAGGLVFALYSVKGDEGAAAQSTIVVTERNLLEALMHKDTRMTMAVAVQALQRAAPLQRQQMIDAYVRDEILYREALSLGLDKHDYATRRRLINQLEYIQQGALEDELQFSTAQLQAYYAEHAADYTLPDKITFTHVYIKAGQDSVARATHLLDTLSAAGTQFHQAGEFGDRFIYQHNYVDRAYDEITSHFGGDFARAIFALPAAPGAWQGPLTSAYGTHVVLVTARTAARQPPLQEVRAQVEQDLRARASAQRLQTLYAQLRKGYQVHVQNSGEAL